MQIVLANVRTPEEREGDLLAQVMSNRRGEDRLREIRGHYGHARVHRITRAPPASSLAPAPGMSRRGSAPPAPARIAISASEAGIPCAIAPSPGTKRSRAAWAHHPEDQAAPPPTPT